MSMLHFYAFLFLQEAKPWNLKCKWVHSYSFCPLLASPLSSWHSRMMKGLPGLERGVLLGHSPSALGTRSSEKHISLIITYSLLGIPSEPRLPKKVDFLVWKERWSPRNVLICMQWSGEAFRIHNLTFIKNFFSNYWPGHPSPFTLRGPVWPNLKNDKKSLCHSFTSHALYYILCYDDTKYVRRFRILAPHLPSEIHLNLWILHLDPERLARWSWPECPVLAGRQWTQKQVPVSYQDKRSGGKFCRLANARLPTYLVKAICESD
jgi:hypothetical protein